MSRTPSQGKYEKPLSKKHRIFTEQWILLGNAEEACKVAGFSPSYAADLCRHEGILKYKAELEKKATRKAVKNLAVTKEMWLEHLWNLSHVSPAETNGNITGQVKAADCYGEGAGFKVKFTADVTQEFKGRTLEEVEFFATNGYFPVESDKSRPN